MTTTRRTLVAALAATAALTLGACGGSTSATGDSGSSSAAAGVDARHNDADATFVTNMHGHHTGAVAMADLAATRASSAEVKALAARIAAAQGPEKERMEALAAAWDVDLPGGSSGHGSGHGAGHGGEDDTAALEPLSGSAFDKQFLTRMTAHHQSALPMAQAELKDGSNAQAKQLAQNILDSQTAEIAEMEQLLTKV